jgi:hypothetical protein
MCITHFTIQFVGCDQGVTWWHELTRKIKCCVIQVLVNELKIKDDNKGYAISPPGSHILLSKDTHDEVIVHDSIIAQATELGAHKNNNLDVPHHKTRFFLLHTLVTQSTKGPIDESSIHGNTKAAFKW